MRVLITGGSGLIGRRLAARLLERGDQPLVLTRDPAKARAALDSRVELVSGDPTTAGEWEKSVETVDAVIHLAGENLFARRWNDDFKRKIRESRTLGTERVAKAVAASPKKPVLVSASAVGIYGPRGDETIDESASPGNDFLSGVCADWERATEPARAAGCRVANARIGVVLDPSGGALAQMLPPFKMFVGGPAGSGRQWVAWVDADDVVRLLLFAVGEPRLSGPFNVTAPEPVTMRDFAKALGRALGRPSLFPVPGFMLRLVLGEVAHVVLTGQRALPKKALDLGFAFERGTIDASLGALLNPRETAASAR